MRVAPGAPAAPLARCGFAHLAGDDGARRDVAPLDRALAVGVGGRCLGVRLQLGRELEVPGGGGRTW